MSAVKGICRETVMDLVREGRRNGEIAQIMGCSRERIGRIVRQSGHQASSQPSGAVVSIVPPWAWEVHEDYRDNARLFGEHAAARHCRRLLEEARAAERFAA